MVPLKSRPGGGGLCGLACVRASDIDAHSEHTFVSEIAI